MVEEIGDVEVSGGFFKNVNGISKTQDGLVARITDDGQGTTVSGLNSCGRSEFGAGKAVGVMTEAKLRGLGLSSAAEYERMQEALSGAALSNSGKGSREYNIKIKDGKFMGLV